ncbi:hypothetical protein EDC04DRAFT_2603989 [Pisolithus marmoratus]|nr:hypothetical protein EDC04DRAFT_2603989 [Pisolithus marmoratus]
MIPVDASLGPELAEFWSKKYKETKEELDNLKTLVTSKSVESSEILDTVRSIKKTVDDEATLRQKLEVAVKEKEELASRVAQLEAEQSLLSKQLVLVVTPQAQLSVTQTKLLAEEVIQQRHSAISRRFPPVQFVERSEQMSFTFTDYREMIGHLPDLFSQERLRLQFVVRPPGSLPLCLPVFGQHGFWFYAPFHEPFHLVAQMGPNEWSYLGQYISAPLANDEMKLSEWMALEEETKTAHCSRQAALTSDEDPLVIRQRYETGERKIPCCSLQCVGYSKLLCEALRVAAGNARLQQMLQQQQQTSTPKDAQAGRSQEAADASQKKGKRKSSCGGPLIQDKSLPKKTRTSPKVIFKLESGLR